jgi:2-polyprenyl-3-methyl-5-hydroxy-6-metoxy-1,4-benzoquinol methylase
MHPNSKLLFQKYALTLFENNFSVLEIGPDSAPSTYQKTLGVSIATWDTLDFSDRLGTPTYLTTSAYDFPVTDDHYDIVLSGQVIEHVPHVWRWMKEVARVCKPGGLVITINPVSWTYHEAPLDCWRIYPEGMKALSEDAGLEVILSTWESVEMDKLTRWLPKKMRQKRHLQKLSGLLEFIERIPGTSFTGAFDTITIARKL